MKTILLLIVLLTIGCTKSDDTLRILKDQGYTNITITGYNHFSCGKGDKFKTGFTALSQANKVVSGTVCTGLFKGSTIRLD